MGNKLDLVINENYSKLNSIDLHILSFIQNNLQLSTTLSIARLAESCNVSTATILRMTQKLNFSGYSEFKYFLKNDADTPALINLDYVFKRIGEKQFDSLEEIAGYFRMLLEDKKNIMLFAYNGTGKTRLSTEFKKLGRTWNPETGEKTEDTLYYNAFTEDLCASNCKRRRIFKKLCVKNRKREGIGKHPR